MPGTVFWPQRGSNNKTGPGPCRADILVWGERYPARNRKVNQIILESDESFGKKTKRKNTQLCKGLLIGVVREYDIELRSELRGGKTWDRTFQKEGSKPQPQS